MSELWRAVLNPQGPNYERLHGVFAEDRVPLKSAKTHKATLGEERDVPVYLLDLAALPLIQRARLFSLVAQKFNVPISVIEEVSAKEGFPIREADVIVSFDMRAFV